ncbi:MAG: hypothetical protein ACYC6M_08285 [Terriglobales bacterium]
MHSVVAAFAAAWIIHIVYLFTLASRQRELRRALNAVTTQRDVR